MNRHGAAGGFEAALVGGTSNALPFRHVAEDLSLGPNSHRLT